jgi:hypothetical protein
MSSKKRLVLGDDNFNVEWLRSVSEDHAIKSLGRALKDINRVRNAWKQANGLSVRNYSQENETEKPTKRKKASKKKSENS